MTWIKWDGGENPAPGNIVLIRMMEDLSLPSGRFPCLSDHLYWHKDCGIVAYKEKRKPFCEHCDKIKRLSAVPSMTMYHWDGEGENPNRDQFLCKECEGEHRAYWSERWSEYRDSQGF